VFGDAETAITLSFSLVSGSLPAGLVLNQVAGEITGVPVGGPGTYNFRILTTITSNGSALTETGYTTVAIYEDITLTVQDNTSTNVDDQNDYSLIRIPDFTTAQFQDRDFVMVNAIFANWTGQFFLNGRQLVQGVEFDAREGSTRITIRSQTFQDVGVGTHTIAAIFRDSGGTGQNMTVATQSFTISPVGGDTGDTGSLNGGTGQVHPTPTPPPIHTVLFVSGSGGAFPSGETGIRTVTHGAQLSTPPNPTRSGHIFTGWWHNNMAVTFPLTVNGDLSLTAAWTVAAAGATPTPQQTPAPTPHPTPAQTTGGSTHANPQTSPIALSFTVYWAVLLAGIAFFGLFCMVRKHLIQVNQYDKDIARHNREKRVTDILDKKTTNAPH